jgi:hypothetical protein
MWKLLVPTYVGSQPHNEHSNRPDFAEPRVPVLVHESEGIRVLMGTHHWEDWDKPDIQVERRPHGWAVFISPTAGDPVACLYMLDSGRTYVMPEKYTEPTLEVVDDTPNDLDTP